jgi:hypothetical protein
MTTQESPSGPPRMYPEPQQQWRPVTTSGFAVASLVLGIVWAFWIGSILALIFGYIALRQIKRPRSAPPELTTPRRADVEDGRCPAAWPLHRPRRPRRRPP